MTAVTFALGTKPGLTGDDANNLAEFLVLRRTPAAVRLAGKIGTHAARLPTERGETSEDVQLEADEAVELLSELDRLLAQPDWAEHRRSFVHLRDALRETLSD